MAEPHQLPDSYPVAADVLSQPCSAYSQHFASRYCELNTAFKSYMMFATSYSYMQENLFKLFHFISLFNMENITQGQFPQSQPAQPLQQRLLPMASDHPTLVQPSICRKSPVATLVELLF